MSGTKVSYIYYELVYEIRINRLTAINAPARSLNHPLFLRTYKKILMMKMLSWNQEKKLFFRLELVLTSKDSTSNTVILWIWKGSKRHCILLRKILYFWIWYLLLLILTWIHKSRWTICLWTKKTLSALFGISLSSPSDITEVQWVTQKYARLFSETWPLLPGTRHTFDWKLWKYHWYIHSLCEQEWQSTWSQKTRTE